LAQWLHAHPRKLLQDGVPAVLAGDYNAAPTEIDIYPTSSWNEDALVHRESRAAYAAGQPRMDGRDPRVARR
jgi:exodeoxyribonuclease-3